MNLNTLFLLLFNALILKQNNLIEINRNDIKNDEKTVDGGSN